MNETFFRNSFDIESIIGTTNQDASSAHASSSNGNDNNENSAEIIGAGIQRKDK